MTEDNDTPQEARDESWRLIFPAALAPHPGIQDYKNRLAKIPKLYRETDPTKLPKPAQRQWAKLVPGVCDPRKRSLILAGPTGRGKSRVAAGIAMTACSMGTWVTWVNAGEIRSAAFSDWGAADKLIRANSKASFLVIDDLGRGAPSAQTDEIIFQILDNRIVEGRPTRTRLPCLGEAQRTASRLTWMSTYETDAPAQARRSRVRVGRGVFYRNRHSAACRGIYGAKTRMARIHPQ